VELRTPLPPMGLSVAVAQLAADLAEPVSVVTRGLGLLAA